MPDLSTPTKTRDFLRLCLNPPARPERTVEQLAEIMPDWLAEPIARHCPQLGALRTAADDAHRAYLAALTAWINNQPLPTPDPPPAPTPTPEDLADTIRQLLAEGLNNCEIRRRTGAGRSTIARLRTETGIPPAPLSTRRRPPHPRRAEALALINAGVHDAEIHRRAGIGYQALRTLRTEVGVPNPGPPREAPEEKWAARTRPVIGGHLEWLGERTGRARTPTMRHRGVSYSPAAIAFRRRTGHNPVGIVTPDCGYPHCMEPTHVMDTAERQRDREQLRALTGAPPRPATCRHGHDQAEHGRYEPDGTPYCAQCNRRSKRAQRARA